MDGLQETGDIFIIGATIRPNSLDPGLRRCGRFDKEIEFGIPDEAGRLDILQTHTRNMKLADDVDLVALSQETEGFVGADLASLCNEAGFLGFREKMELLDDNEEDGKVDAEVLNVITASNENFLTAKDNTIPSSKRME